MSFYKGFLSLFDWMFPKTLEEQFEDLDNSMQKLYDKMGWGKYNNPCAGHTTACDLTRSISSSEWNSMVKDNKTVEEVYGNVRVVTSSEFLDEMIKLAQDCKDSGGFQPYAYYNEDMDAIETYFKDESCYTKTLNNMVELHLSFDNDEVVGVNILGIKKLIQDKGKFK